MSHENIDTDSFLMSSDLVQMMLMKQKDKLF